MICWSSSPTIRRRPGEGRGPRGFTLVELLVVILILAVLIALLLPAINAAVRTAKNAAVGSEINQLAQALASFKAKYGDYPPSRILLCEDGDWSAANIPVSQSPPLGTGDITLAQLAQRSVAALRKFFPSVTFSTAGKWWTNLNGQYYDFNGNGTFDQNHYILQGHQCLVFFLGGIPQVTAAGFGASGFAKNPLNPFVNSSITTNRQAPFFEFDSGRLALDPSNPYPVGLGLVFPQIPGYLDSLGNESVGPLGVLNSSSGLLNFYAYFNSYGNGGYDPNDVNFPSELDANLSEAGLTYYVPFPVIVGTTTTNYAQSPAPNPYTSSLTSQKISTTYLNPQSFQIISSGIDGQYGVGGQYAPNNTPLSLPLDPNATFPLGPYLPYLNTQDSTIRYRERDNITNFHNGKLE